VNTVHKGDDDVNDDDDDNVGFKNMGYKYADWIQVAPAISSFGHLKRR
jgi:hypothetical protein